MDSQPLSSEDQLRRFWNWWDAKYLENSELSTASLRRGEEVIRILESLHLSNPEILEVGCGNGWLAARLAHFGHVTGVDIADEVINRARAAIPVVRFLSGDITTMNLTPGVFDVLVTVETIGNVPDHQSFVNALGRLVKPGGYLILTAQNKYVFDRREDTPPPEPGQIRNWVDRNACRSLLKRDFKLVNLTTIMPAGHLGLLRFANAYKVDTLARRFGVLNRINRIREWLGLGQTIVVLAVRK